MRSLSTLFLAACVAGSVAMPLLHADEASRRAKADQMLLLTKTDEMMKQQMAGLEARVNGMAKQQAGNGTLTPAQQKITADYQKQVSVITDDQLGWEKLRPVVVQQYAAAFTEAELDAIIAFYKTPAGQAILDKTPGLAQQTMTLVQDHIKLVQPKLVEVTKVYDEQMKAAAAPVPAAPAPAAGAVKK